MSRIASLAGVDASSRLPMRRGTAADVPAILALLTATLGWVDDERHRALYRWKHVDNHFGPSPCWVACDADTVVGVRLLMRWRFRRGHDVVEAVRAVDTATDRAYQGRGIFSSLTRMAVDEVRDEGVQLVFNTPNDQSRPGYLKMGWQVVGRLPLALRPTSLRALPRMAKARVPADLWSTPSRAGVPAAEVLHDPALGPLVADAAFHAADLATEMSVAYLQWRFGLSALDYRVIALGDDPVRGVAFFRVRRRGPAREAALGLVLVPGGEKHAAAALVREVVRRVDADYVAVLGPRPWAGLVPAPRLGPVLTARPVYDGFAVPELAKWRLGLADVELA